MSRFNIYNHLNQNERELYKTADQLNDYDTVNSLWSLAWNRYQNAPRDRMLDVSYACEHDIRPGERGYGDEEHHDYSYDETPRWEE